MLTFLIKYWWLTGTWIPYSNQLLLCVDVQNIDKIPLVNCPVLIIHVSFLWRCCNICFSLSQIALPWETFTFVFVYMVSFFSFSSTTYMWYIFSLFFPFFLKCFASNSSELGICEKWFPALIISIWLGILSGLEYL